MKIVTIIILEKRLYTEYKIVSLGGEKNLRNSNNKKNWLWLKENGGGDLVIYTECRMTAILTEDGSIKSTRREVAFLFFF